MKSTKSINNEICFICKDFIRPRIELYIDTGPPEHDPLFDKFLCFNCLKNLLNSINRPEDLAEQCNILATNNRQGFFVNHEIR